MKDLFYTIAKMLLIVLAALYLESCVSVYVSGESIEHEEVRRTERQVGINHDSIGLGKNKK